MNLETLVNHHGGQAAFARQIGVARQVINRVLRDHRKISPELSIRIYLATGQKFGMMNEPLEPQK